MVRRGQRRRSMALRPAGDTADAGTPGRWRRSAVELDNLGDTRAGEHTGAGRLVVGDVGIEELDDPALLLVTGGKEDLGGPFPEDDAIPVPIHVGPWY